MPKFMVVLYKPDMSESEFHNFLPDVHGPMALKIPRAAEISPGSRPS